jgi:hypothetical protein
VGVQEKVSGCAGTREWRRSPRETVKRHPSTESTVYKPGAGRDVLSYAKLRFVRGVQEKVSGGAGTTQRRHAPRDNVKRHPSIKVTVYKFGARKSVAL